MLCDSDDAIGPEIVLPLIDFVESDDLGGEVGSLLNSPKAAGIEAAVLISLRGIVLFVDSSESPLLGILENRLDEEPKDCFGDSGTPFDAGPASRGDSGIEYTC